MYRLFGAKKKEEAPPPPPPAPEKKEPEPQIQVPSLSEQQKRIQTKVRELSQTITLVDKEMRELYDKAKTARGNSKQMYRQRCVQLLKKRKQYEGQLKNYMSQQYTLDQVAFTKDSVQNNLEMATAMKQAVGEQQKMFENLDMDAMDDIRDEMEEMAAESEYMNELMNRDYDVDVNEGDLDEELRALELEYRDEIKNKPQQKSQIYKSNLNKNVN